MKKIITAVYYIFRDVTISGIASLLAALFFLYGFGFGGLYLTYKKFKDRKLSLDPKIQQQLDKQIEEKMSVYTVMILFNFVVWITTIYFIIKFL